MSNRLEKEDSPYLQQHKNNPVEWFPWCDEAFKKAEKENKAIFISIGYSSCHWCHVMEEKVFENEECSKILNENFISIKVDREERPDIDKYYQEVYQLLNNRSGGWPTSIFCTPQNKPFFAGTYIPPESQTGSIEGMGFKDITNLIASKVKENDPSLYKNADEVDSFLKKENHPTEATILNESFKENFLLQVKNAYETRDGGFSVSPKFPHTSTLNTLLTIDKLYNDKSAKAMVTHTLNSMKKGGFYDLVDGGFCRYSVDSKWKVPHFEKMLYDNALLCEIYTKAYLTYKDDSYLTIAKEIADFWFEYMSEENLFYGACDADTDGEEGLYFTYNYDELYSLLYSDNFTNIETILEQMSVTKDGNFEGKNIIRFEDSIQPKEFEKIKPLLQKIRKDREYPFIDKKIQTSWSSMMIKSLFLLGSIDSSYTQKAINSLDSLLETLHIDGNLYHSTLIHKTPKIGAFLEDYAFLSSALVTAYNYTQDETYLVYTQKFVNSALSEFYKNGIWKFSNGDFDTKAEITDNTYTSSVSTMVDVLISLSSLLEDEKYKHFAFKTLEYNSYELGRKPIHYPTLLTQMFRYLKGDRIIKSNSENLATLSSLEYPFTLKKLSQNQEFLICGDKSCFSTTNNINEINNLIKNSF